MNLANWSIRNPVAGILLFVLLSLAGITGFMRLPVQAWPDVQLPTVEITLTEPGAAPAQLEAEVVRKVENALAALGSVKHILTTVTDGKVFISVQFELGKDLSSALIECKNTVDSIRPQLPASLEQPVVAPVNASGDPVLVYAVSSSRMNERDLSWFVDDTVSRAVQAIPGVGAFRRVGGMQRQVRVEVDPTQMAALGISAADVSQALRNMQQQSSGGRTELGGSEQSIRVIATVHEASDLAALPLTLHDGRTVRLDQFATVADTHAERTQMALLDGKRVVAFSVSRAMGHDETAIAAQVSHVLAQLGASHPDVRFLATDGSITATRAVYSGSMHMLYEGALLAVIVVWWFLRDWRATFVAACALPLSILPTFAAMSWFGFSLNTLTLLALAVVIGILVDDAIVEVENIEAHRRNGKSIRRSVDDAIHEIALPVVATTMALVAVFLPTATMGGITGRYFVQFGWTSVIAVLASLLVARVLTPILAIALLGNRPAHRERHGRLMQRYLDAVRWCLTHPKLTLSAAALYFVGSLALVPFIPSGFVPATDNSSTRVTLSLPPDSSLASTVAMTETARAALATLKGVDHVFANVNKVSGELTLILAPRGARPNQTEIEAQARRALSGIPGARFTVGGSGAGDQLRLILASDDDGALNKAARALESELRGVGSLTNVNSTANLERPELVVRPDLDRTSNVGASTEAIGDIVRITTSGDFGTNLARLDLDNRQVDINVSMPDAYRRDLSTVSNLRIPTASGTVPLASIATLTVGSGPSRIDRRDRRRYIVISADLDGMHLGDAISAAYKLPSVLALPPGVALIPDGDAELQGELAGGFVTAIAVGILCVYCVLALLFRDLLQPVTILSALPLSIGGALLALLATRNELSVPSMLGLLMLMGVVSKNSILLVEHAILHVRGNRLTLHQALLDACYKRARPIVMTTMAMVAGMAPIALGFGADASFRRPMAVAVIGGLITSTALSLLVVPVVFVYIDRFRQFLIRMAAGLARTRRQVARGATLSATQSKTSRPPANAVGMQNE
ncbi:efflux RND transporter permease subunit [Burkholderia pyrrocinia]|uniref:efflux RND transporter permease subunit n=1 Tax=Burkholderia pyrrocinia TaxID=60550 RepID=UPI0015883EB4|nr:efflux RND transporter permease subunit [Burkholderia pyrrocinia]